MSDSRSSAGPHRMRSGPREDHSELPTLIAGAMREEPVVVALGAEWADRDLVNAERAGVIRDQRAKVHLGRSPRIPAGELCEHLRAHFVAAAADRRAAVESQVGRFETKGAELANSRLGDASGRASPPGMEGCGRAARVREEDGHAVSDGDGHSRAALRAEMAVSLRTAKESLPIATMANDMIAVHLKRRGETRRGTSEESADCSPPGGDAPDRFIGLHAEAARGSRGGERQDAEAAEGLDDLASLSDVRRHLARPFTGCGGPPPESTLRRAR